MDGLLRPVPEHRDGRPCCALSRSIGMDGLLRPVPKLRDGRPCCNHPCSAMPKSVAIPYVPRCPAGRLCFVQREDNHACPVEL